VYASSKLKKAPACQGFFIAKNNISVNDVFPHQNLHLLVVAYDDDHTIPWNGDDKCHSNDSLHNQTLKKPLQTGMLPCPKCFLQYIL
jgi:hypothetical protein